MGSESLRSSYQQGLQDFSSYIPLWVPFPDESDNLSRLVELPYIDCVLDDISIFRHVVCELDRVAGWREVWARGVWREHHWHWRRGSGHVWRVGTFCRRAGVRVNCRVLGLRDLETWLFHDQHLTTCRGQLTVKRLILSFQVNMFYWHFCNQLSNKLHLSRVCLAKVVF